MTPYNVLIISKNDNILFNYQNPIFKNYTFFNTDDRIENILLLCKEHQIQLVITCEIFFARISEKLNSIEFELQFIILQKNASNKIFLSKIQKQKTTIIKYPYDDFEINQALEHTTAYYNLLKENKLLRKEIKRLENREFSLLKKEVLNNLSHEIRTPLNAIIGFANLLICRNNITRKNKEYISIIEEASNRLVNYIENLSEFLRHEKAIEEDFPLSYISIYEILQSIVSIFHPAALNKNIVLMLEEIEPEMQHIKIKSNKHKIIAILTKLIKSAIYNSKNGLIKLGLTKNNQGFICLEYTEKIISKNDYSTLLGTMLNSNDSTKTTLDNELIEITLIKRNIKHLKGSYRIQKVKNTLKISLYLPFSLTVSLMDLKIYKDFN